uniref:Uncharacterized protein n=1 Tax=Nelumbo nucifera TaxID=4432 RepID=A0A822Z2W8_NELNU|nr:TPA_asm: hypothetical protein HUJ06_013450 [Nelumbo nucifera]
METVNNHRKSDRKWGNLAIVRPPSRRPENRV